MANNTNNTIAKILAGEIPEVPLKITIETQSIVRVCIALLITTTICILIAKIVLKKST